MLKGPLLLAFAMAGAAAAASSQCSTCHPAQAGIQPQTSMAHALIPGGDPRVLAGHPKMTVSRSGFVYTVEARGAQITYTVSDATGSITVPVRWTIGANAHTWVLQYSGRLFESLVSYYPGLQGLDVTTGDEHVKPATLLEALGRELSPQEQLKCFGCHSPSSVSGNQLFIEKATTGLQCEHCHQDAAPHMAALAQGKAGVKPKRMGELSSEQISEFCGRCHRTWDDVMNGALRGPIDVRFQPYRQANSKCYDGVDRRLSCTGCHDPHREVVRGAAAYDAKCLACHAAANAASCNVAKSGCTTCHMPKVEVPGMHQKFTDHQIRIVHAGEPYPD